MTKQVAITNYRTAREMSHKVCEAYLSGKASEQEFLAARRAYEAAGKELDKARAA